jgi:hypothetical protein
MPLSLVVYESARRLGGDFPPLLSPGRPLSLGPNGPDRSGDELRPTLGTTPAAWRSQVDPQPPGRLPACPAVRPGMPSRPMVAWRPHCGPRIREPAHATDDGALGTPRHFGHHPADSGRSAAGPTFRSWSACSGRRDHSCRCRMRAMRSLGRPGAKPGGTRGHRVRAVGRDHGRVGSDRGARTSLPTEPTEWSRVR